MGVQNFRGQNYEKLKKSCMKKGQLWDDPLFPSNDDSLALSEMEESIVWKRPPEICTNPKLFVNYASSNDVTQGRLGKCWFVAACSALAIFKPLWKEVLPDYELQEWNKVKPKEYAGIFHFRFWNEGYWVDVCVDDKLPTIDNKLVFCHSSTRNEFWSALLEKAYAKLLGSYGALNEGNLCDSLIGLTSGVLEVIEFKNKGYRTDEDARDAFRKQLLRDHEHNSIMCCAKCPADASEFEKKTEAGLVVGHPYSITAIRVINWREGRAVFKSGDTLTLLRLRNPWGSGSTEWNGAFSDGSSEWNKISDREKAELQLVFEDDGEFWMSFEDFLTHFTDISICHVINNSVLSVKDAWNETMLKGKWTMPNYAGGCPNEQSFLRNPQYVFTVPTKNMEIIVQLLQTQKRQSSEYDSIGFCVLKVEENREHRIYRKRKMTRAIISDYMRQRSIYFRGTIKKGRHVLIPSTFSPNLETEFVLRIFFKGNVSVKELTEDHPKPMGMCTRSYALCVTNIIILKATQLATNNGNTYCIIKVEGKSLQSDVVLKSQEPEWNLEGIFFRYSLSTPIVVEIWETNLPHDRFLGCASIVSGVENKTNNITCPLLEKKTGEKQCPGQLYLQITSYDDLVA